MGLLLDAAENPRLLDKAVRYNKDIGNALVVLSADLRNIIGRIYLLELVIISSCPNVLTDLPRLAYRLLCNIASPSQRYIYLTLYKKAFDSLAIRLLG